MKLIIIILFLIVTSFLVLFTFDNVLLAFEEDTGTKKSSAPVTLDNPLGGKEPADINKLIGNIINAILGVVGSLSLLMFIYGGLVWMTAAGSKEKIQKGKDILVWSTVGLVVIFMSYAIVKFVLTDLIQGAGGG